MRIEVFCSVFGITLENNRLISVALQNGKFLGENPVINKLKIFAKNLFYAIENHYCVNQYLKKNISKRQQPVSKQPPPVS